MLRTMFECPETGEPLASTMLTGRFPAGDTVAVSRHCPKCGQTHHFEAKDAIVLMDGAPAPAEVAGALVDG